MSSRSGRGVFGKLFAKKQSKERDERAAEIGMPTNVKQHIHVSKNSETGMLEGLPNSWLRLLNTQITPAEQNENPDAAYKAVALHMHLLKKEKAPDEPFKPLITEEVITEEDKEINDLIYKKNAHQSQDSDLSYGQSSEEDAVPPTIDISYPQRQTMPVSPSKNSIKKKDPTVNITATVEDLSLLDEDEPEESPILRKKEIANATLTDEEIYAELKRICNKDDPYVRFERVKEVGSGASGMK